GNDYSGTRPTQLVVCLRPERASASSQSHTHQARRRYIQTVGKILLAIGIEISHDNGKRLPARRIVDGCLQRAISIAQEHTYGIIATVCCGEIGFAVAIKIAESKAL